MISNSEMIFSTGDVAGDTWKMMGMISPDGVIENDEVISLSLTTDDLLVNFVSPSVTQIKVLSPDSEFWLIATVEPPNNGHFGTSHFVLY